MKIEKINDLRGTKGSQLKTKIFIVHGHNEALKESVARFLEKVGLDPIILHEQANEGKTIIEKFEKHSSSVEFSIVLITGDDLAKPKKSNTEELTPRARQNVIFELGFFIGALGRKGVCALYENGVELPSDYQGNLYISIDEAGTWKYSLAKELKGAGYSVDLNVIT